MHTADHLFTSRICHIFTCVSYFHYISGFWNEVAVLLPYLDFRGQHLKRLLIFAEQAYVAMLCIHASNLRFSNNCRGIDFAQSDCNLYQLLMIIHQVCKVDLLSFLKSSALESTFAKSYSQFASAVYYAIERVNVVVRMCMVDSNFG